MEGKESRVLADMRKGLSLPIVLQWGQHMHVLLTCQNRCSLRRVVKCLCAYRERQEKAENKARAAAETNWRNLLRSIFTRIKVQGDYADDAGNGSGKPKCSYSVPSQRRG
jgi:hypothetical protein